MDLFKKCCLAFHVLLSVASITRGIASAQSNSQHSKRPIDYANGLVGTASLDDPKLIGNAPPPGEQLYSGFTTPGALLPHSSTELSPINVNLDLSYPAGVGSPYLYGNRMMLGFSSGSGDGPTIMPIVGDWTVPPDRRGSVYDKAKEKSSPGYYSAYLDDFKTLAEMTVTQWTGIFRFTFPESQKSNITLDLGRSGGDIEIVNDHTIHGRRKGAHSYFIAEFSQPFIDSGVFKQNPPSGPVGREPLLGFSDVSPREHAISGAYAGAYVRFNTNNDERVLVKVATGSSYENAEERLRNEDPGWDFNAVRQSAEAAWTRKLGQIDIEGGTEKQRMLFYSCLYHSFASPRLVASKGQEMRARDGQTHKSDYDRYGEVPFWDTGRNQIVLLTLLEPELKLDILRSQLDMAKESGYMGTSFHGDNAVFMYLGDWERGLHFDWSGTYEYLRKNATDPAGPRGYLAEYMKNGWISDEIPKGNPSPPYAGGKAGAATTLEYSWDDYAMALYAKKLGKADDYELFLKRAHNYQNVFDREVGFIRGRTEDGRWISPFDPKEPFYNFMMKEASGWSTLWLVPHDIQGLINLLGGREKFSAKLDEFFNTPYTAKGICRDCTGVIGQYVQGNQPDQQAAYLYAWAGQPWKTQRLTRQIMEQMYGSDKSGYAFPGMDDQGSTSSWYVMSALGFYTVDPSSPNYILGSPLFSKATLHLGSGKNFSIVAYNNSEGNRYIQSAKLNGKSWNKPWMSHSDIAPGGQLELTMGPSPNPAWGSAQDAAPPSMTDAR